MTFAFFFMISSWFTYSWGFDGGSIGNNATQSSWGLLGAWAELGNKLYFILHNLTNDLV